MQTSAIFGGLGKIFKGDMGERTRKTYQPKVDAINALERQMQKLSDEELRNKTAQLKQRLQKGEQLDDLLIEAFAVSAALKNLSCCLISSCLFRVAYCLLLPCLLSYKVKRRISELQAEHWTDALACRSSEKHPSGCSA